jgi:Protein of unknown function (DUF3025)
MNKSPLPETASSAFLTPLDPGASALRALGRWPDVTDIDRTLAGAARVRFALAAPKPRSRRIAARLKDRVSYDARIVDEGVVPTRPQCMHDLMNALVWAAFPHAKSALHVRQRALVESSTEPAHRSVEHDTIAMLDEGGVLLLGEGAADESIVKPDECFIFGHAIYEHIAGSRGPVYGLGVPLGRGVDTIEGADRALAGMLENRERFTTHRCFPRVRVG